MSGTALWPWVVLLCLGACHGLNPGLGWLFAVALSLQERRRATVYRALGPIALGHALSITAVLVVIGQAYYHFLYSGGAFVRLYPVNPSSTSNHAAKMKKAAVACL